LTYASSNFTVTCSTGGTTYYPLDLDTLVEDDTNNYVSATATFTIPEAGVYRFIFKILDSSYQLKVRLKIDGVVQDPMSSAYEFQSIMSSTEEPKEFTSFFAAGK